MKSVNEIHLVGRVGQVNFTLSGADRNKETAFTVATTLDCTDEYGSPATETTWFNVVYPEVIKNLTKGQEVDITGRIKSELRNNGISYIVVADAVDILSA